MSKPPVNSLNLEFLTEMYISIEKLHAEGKTFTTISFTNYYNRSFNYYCTTIYALSWSQVYGFDDLFWLLILSTSNIACNF